MAVPEPKDGIGPSDRGAMSDDEQAALGRIARLAVQQHTAPPAFLQSPESITANLSLTVRVAPAATVAKLGQPPKDVASPIGDGVAPGLIDACRQNEAKILQWLAQSPANLARFTADPVSALADAQLIDAAAARTMARYRDGLRGLLQSQPAAELTSLVLKPDA